MTMVALGAFIVTSCSPSGASGPAAKAPTAEQKQLAKDRFEKFSKVAVYNETMDKIIILEQGIEKNSFSFADPADGWNFGSTDNIQFVEGPDGTEVLFISANGGAGDGAGGFVTAGNSTLSIDFAFCFSVDDETLFSAGDEAPIDGVSGVFGFSGDLEAISETDWSEEGAGDIFDFFNGWAYYWVYADVVEGSYDILDWLDDEIVIDDLQDEGFAFVYDFNEGHLYWSIEGTLDVSGGQMEFDGEYFAWLNFLDLFFDGADLEDTSFDEVDGSGAMGCD